MHPTRVHLSHRLSHRWLSLVLVPLWLFGSGCDDESDTDSVDAAQSADQTEDCGLPPNQCSVDAAPADATPPSQPDALLPTPDAETMGPDASPDAEPAPDASPDAEPAPDASPDAEPAPDASPDAEPVPALTPVGDGEHDIGYGWLGAAQPTEARLREVVELGARVISLREEAEDPFDEAALVESLGGEFLRFATQSGNLPNAEFRNGLYDFYDAQLDRPPPVYLHCASSNRVGASWALYHAERRGVDPEEAVQMGIDAGLRSLEPVVREILGL